jgi:putative nucleotidyltransferase with HDIG domain
MASHYDEIERLVRSTFDLWDLTRVGFSWRKYYLNHTYRVQGLSMSMGQVLEGDQDLLRHAAILHDITKRYDGAILKTGDGKNVIDEEGFWLNETIRPDRHNWVTELYDRLELQGQIHHVSGATMTEHVLREFGYPENYIRPVAKIVRGHLKGKVPPEVHDERYKEVEVRILYDADTIDPNVGLTAFYRNIQITAGNLLKRGETVDLAGYVQNLPRWVNSKDAFREHMLTDLGKEVCDSRQARNRQVMQALNDELTMPDVNRSYGLLGVLEYLFTNPEDPSLHEHARGLWEEWLPAREAALAEDGKVDRDLAGEALLRSRSFIEQLHEEIDGRL